MMLLSTVAVGLRFLSRRLSKAQVAWSDWTILIALVNLPWPCLGSTFNSNSIQPLGWLPVLLMISCRLDSAHNRHGLTSIIGVRCYGFGKHIQQTSAQDNRGFWHLFYVAEITYPMAVAVTKISLLLFYWRNCHVAALRITNVAVGILIVMWAFSTVCYPQYFELTVKLNYRPWSWRFRAPQCLLSGTTRYPIRASMPFITMSDKQYQIFLLIWQFLCSHYCIYGCSHYQNLKR